MEKLFTLIQNHSNPVPIKMLTLENACTLIKGGLNGKYEQTVTQMRAIDGKDYETRKNLRKPLKNNLPAIVFNAVCKDRVMTDNVTATTGYIIMDIDGLSDDKAASNMMASELRDNLFNNNRLGVVLCFVSPSGEGVKALVRVPQVNVANYVDWQACVAYFFNKECPSIKCDDDAKNITRLCYLSVDPYAKLSTDPSKHFTYTLDDWKRMVEQDGKNVKSQDKIADLKPKSGYKGYVPTSADKPQLQKFMKLFAAYCVKHSICLWDANNTYNHWLGFGSQCKDLFDGTQDGLDVWDDCSRFASNYDQKVIYDKYNNNKLPEGTFHSIIGTIINAAKVQGRSKSIESVITNLKIKSGIM